MAAPIVGRAKRWTRVRNVVVGSAIALGVAAAFIEIGARWNVLQERKRRAYLGDRLYKEVVGGAGDPIVLIAGLQGSTRYWNHAFDELGRDHRVIYVDLLGFGRSPWPDIEYTLDDHLAALRRTLVSAGATRNVVFVAHSFGTIIASEYAARHTDEVKHLYLLGTPVYDSEGEARRRIWEMSPLAAMFSLRPILAREACLLMGSLRPLFKWAMPRMSPDLPPAVAEDALLHSWGSIRGAINNILLSRPIARPLGSVGTKTTLIHGTRDTITTVDRIRSLAQETGAGVLLVDSDHHGYVRHCRDVVVGAINSR